MALQPGGMISKFHLPPDQAQLLASKATKMPVYGPKSSLDGNLSIVRKEMVSTKYYLTYIYHVEVPI